MSDSVVSDDITQAFIQIPNDVLKNTDLHDRFFLLITFLRVNCSQDGTIFTSHAMLASKMGYKPNRHRGGIDDINYTYLKWLEERSYIFILDDIDRIKYKDCFEVKLNLESDLFSPVKKYTQIFKDEYQKIIAIDSSIDKGRLFRLYVVLKSHLNADKTQEQYVWPSISLISRKLGISRGTNLCKAIDELKKNNVIYTYCPGSYLDNQAKRKNTNTFYAFEPDSFDGADDIALAYVHSIGLDIVTFDPKVVNPHLKKQAAKKNRNTTNTISGVVISDEEAEYWGLPESYDADDECRDLY